MNMDILKHEFLIKAIIAPLLGLIIVILCNISNWKIYIITAFFIYIIYWFGLAFHAIDIMREDIKNIKEK